jgi:hypothetical protein
MIFPISSEFVKRLMNLNVFWNFDVCGGLVVAVAVSYGGLWWFCGLLRWSELVTGTVMMEVLRNLLKFLMNLQ